MTIQIANWILTRRCNLNCSYCRISRNYQKPCEYPDLKHFFLNEMSTDFIIDSLKRIKKHNENCFHIFYGGEPTMRSDLGNIIKFCNDSDINYTIISNMTEWARKQLKNMISEVGYFKGLTASIDPSVMGEESYLDQFDKSSQGITYLEDFSEYCKDLVAEITVDKFNLKFLYPLVLELSNRNINSDITFIDIAKNYYYDFSNIAETDSLVYPTSDLKEIFNNIIKYKLNAHMAPVLFPKILEILPSNMNCEIDKSIHNITIDADGSVRLCLRCRGIRAPKRSITDYLDLDGCLSSDLIKNIKEDKRRYCNGCNWTCMLHSKLVEENEQNLSGLLHKD